MVTTKGSGYKNNVKAPQGKASEEESLNDSRISHRTRKLSMSLFYATKLMSSGRRMLSYQIHQISVIDEPFPSVLQLQAVYVTPIIQIHLPCQTSLSKESRR